MHPDEAARIARELIRQQRYREAQRICQQALAATTQSAELRELSAHAHIAIGDIVPGVRELRRAIEIDAGVPETWHALAEAYMILDHAADAESTIAAGLDRFPHDTRLQALLALRLLASGQADDALETADVALASDPDCLDAHRAAAGAALALQALERAMTHCRRILELAPLDIGARRRMARIQYLQGETETAIETLQAALNLEPAHPQVLDELAQHYHQAGWEDDATACWQRLSELYPEDHSVAQATGRGLAAAGRSGEALPHLVRAARAPEIEPRVWLDLSACLDAEHRPGQALAACERYLELRPEDEEAHQYRERLNVRLESQGD